MATRKQLIKSVRSGQHDQGSRIHDAAYNEAGNTDVDFNAVLAFLREGGNKKELMRAAVEPDQQNVQDELLREILGIITEE